MKRFALLATAAAVTVGSFAVGSAIAGYGDKAKADKKMTAKTDIVATAVAAGKFNTLAAALEAAELIETLQGDGPFTVFAPLDEAFAKLPSGTVETLLQPENQDQLRDVLLYHVVAGQTLMAADVVNADEAETAQGEAIAIAIEDGKVILNGSVAVVKTDIKATNGVIHVLDGVLLPSGDESEGDGM